MDASDIIKLYRLRADDAVFPYHTSDDDLVMMIAEAEEEACIRARLIFDESSAACSIPLVAGVGRYALDPTVFDIDRVRFIRADGVEFNTTRAGMGEMVAADRSITGRPYKFAHTEDSAITVWPTPDANSLGTLKLSVYRTPLYPVMATDDPLEIHERWYSYLVDWLLYRVYGQKDTELRDDMRSAEAYARFESRFGVRRPADIMRQHREKRPVTIGYSGP